MGCLELLCCSRCCWYGKRSHWFEIDNSNLITSPVGLEAKSLVLISGENEDHAYYVERACNREDLIGKGRWKVVCLFTFSAPNFVSVGPGSENRQTTFKQHTLTGIGGTHWKGRFEVGLCVPWRICLECFYSNFWHFKGTTRFNLWLGGVTKSQNHPDIWVGYCHLLQWV